MKTRRWPSGLLQQLNCYPQVYERELGLDIPAEEVEPSETKPLEADGMLWLTWLAFKWRAGLIRGPQERRAVCIRASRPVRAENDEFRSVRGGGVEAGGPGQVYVCAVRSQPRKMNH